MRLIHYKWCLLFAFAFFYLLPLGWHPLWMPDETRYAEISREMVSSGNWIVPYFMGVQYFEKPIMGYWMNNISQLLFGYNNFAARLAPALSIGLTGLIVYRFVTSVLKDERKALYSTLVYMSFPLVFGIGTYNILDSELTLWMVASFASFYHAMTAQTCKAMAWRYILFGVFGGCAFLTKGFVGLAILVIAIVPFMAIMCQLKQIFFYGSLSVFSAIIVALPWSLAVAYYASDYWHFFFWNENIRRFGASNAQHLHPIWFYIPVLLLSLFPWTTLAPKAIATSFSDSTHKKFFLYQACCFILPFILLSIVKGKLPTYILPLMMPLGILIGCGLAELIQQKHRIVKISIWANTLVFGMAIFFLTLLQFGVFGKTQGYVPTEMTHFWLVCILLFGCASLPIFSLLNIQKTPVLFAILPITMLLLVQFILPMKVVNSKLPEVFFRQYVKKIQPNAWVLSNSVALIGGIGWVLHRSDINLLHSTGELSYGVEHSEEKLHYTFQEFRDDLALKRQTRQVVLTLEVGTNKSELLNKLPTPTEQYHVGRFYLYVYSRHL